MSVVVAVALVAGTSVGTVAQAADAPMVPVVYSDRISVDVDVAPSFLWNEIKRMYVDGDKFKRQGFSITPIRNDPTAYLGGMVIEKNEKGIVDRRETRFTTIDDRVFFLALTAKYIGGEIVYASYSVRPTPKGSNFQLILHAAMTTPVDQGITPTPAYVRSKVQAFAMASHKEIADGWAVERARIEVLARVAKKQSTIGHKRPALP